jgi:hypothetical protein
MEHVAGSSEFDDLREALILSLAIRGVTHQGEPEVFEVHTNLVGAPGVESGFDQRCLGEPLQHAVTGPRIPSCSIGDSHSFAVRWVARNCGPDLPLARVQGSTKERVVKLLHLSRFELGRERKMRSIILGDDHAPAGVAIQSVNNARSGHAANAAESALAMVEKRVDKRSPLMAGGRMGYHARGFVQHQEVLIFKQDAQRDGLGFGRGRSCGGPMDFDALPGFGGKRRLDGVPVDVDMPFPDEALDRPARERGKAGTEPGIESLCGTGPVDGQDGLRGYSFHHRISPEARTMRLNN